MQAINESDKSIVADLLELVEAHYVPRVAEEQKEAKKKKKAIEVLEEEIADFK